MKFELVSFLGIILGALIVIAFLLECKSNRQAANTKKDAHLQGKRCEVCFSVYFISSFLKYWRCPLCGSINRDDDYRNRNSSG